MILLVYFWFISQDPGPLPLLIICGGVVEAFIEAYLLLDRAPRD